MGSGMGLETVCHQDSCGLVREVACMYANGHRPLYLLGIHGPGWLAIPELAKPALILMGVWTIGGTIVIFLAGLQDIPAQLYEAAMIDGAGVLARVRHVTLPMLSPVIFFNVIIGLIGGFQIFTQAFMKKPRRSHVYRLRVVK